MPTFRGWAITVSGALLWIAGRVFGAAPLEQLGFGLIALVAIAVALLRFGRHDVKVTRRIVPEKVHAGHEVKVGLLLDNLGDGPLPVALLEDQVPHTLGVRPRFVLDGLRAGDRTRFVYPFRPGRRGRWHAGPLIFVLKDPFGVAALKMTAGGRASFVVYPRTERLILPRVSGTRRTLNRAAQRQLTGSRGEDFYTMREYVEGDDLRQIHWPSTAKRGRYMIRQEETPWQTRATIVLDDRAEAHDDPSWERAIEVAASLADLYLRSDYTFGLRLALAEGIARGRGEGHFHRVMELLARLETSATSRSESDPVAARLARVALETSSDDDLVVVAGQLSEAATDEMIRCSAGSRSAILISVGAAPEAALVRLRTAGVRVLQPARGEPLAPAWEAAWSDATSVRRHGGGELDWEAKRAPA